MQARQFDTHTCDGHAFARPHKHTRTHVRTHVQIHLRTHTCTRARAGKYGIGTRVFVNKMKYAAYKVTLARVKDYLKLERLKKSVQSIIGSLSLKEFEDRYLSLECATKKRVFVNGKMQVMILQ